MWKGYQGPAQLVSESFKEVYNNPNIGNIDAAFSSANLNDHDRIYFFLVPKIVYAVIVRESNHRFATTALQYCGLTYRMTRCSVTTTTSWKKATLSK